MKILQIMPQYPFPMVDGGKVSLGNIAIELAELGHEVHVVCFHPDGAPRQDPPNVTVHTVDHVPGNTPLRIWASIFRRRSLYTSKHDIPAMHQMIDDVIEEFGIDVIHADHTCMAPIADEACLIHGIPWGFRLHNVEWLIWQRYAERFSRWHPARWYLMSQARKVREEETAALLFADVIFPITTVDAGRIRDMMPGAIEEDRICVAPAGVTEASWRRDRHEASPLQVVMATNYHWVHNVDALQWFVNEVWPSVRKQFVDVSFHVIGRDPPKWVEDRRQEGIFVDGFVDDLADRYASASISVAPLFVGSGIRLKIIEAMAAGLPVVATSVSAEGIELYDGEGLFRSDTPSETVAQITRLLGDTEARLQAGVNAQSGVIEKYTWKASIAVMEGAYARLHMEYSDETRNEKRFGESNR